MKSRPLTATSFRVILSVSLFAIAIIIGVLFYFGRAKLMDVSNTVNQAVADADTSAKSLDTFKKTEADLKTNQAAVTRAKQLTADLFDYNYQNRIINDLQTYGAQTGVGVEGVDFGASAASTGGAAAPAATAPATPATPAAGATAPATGGSTSKAVTIVVSLTKPVDYANTLKFIYAIEQNLPKMQISKLTIARDTTNPSLVTVSDITMQMYVK